MVLWQTRKLQVIVNLQLPAGIPTFSTLVFCEARKRMAAQPHTELEELSLCTPALPAENSAWNTLSEGICSDLREMGYLILADPRSSGDEENVTNPSAVRQLASRLYVAGGGQQPGQAHLIDLHEGVVPHDDIVTESSPWPRNSVTATADCVISTTLGGAIHASNGVAMSTTHLRNQSASETRQHAPWSVSVDPSTPFLARYQAGGVVDIFLAAEHTHTQEGADLHSM